MDRRSEMVTLVIDGRAIRGVFCNSEMSKMAVRAEALRVLSQVQESEDADGPAVVRATPCRARLREAAE